jgi:thiol-disulfide isomerase/thioredoxin
MRFQVGKCPSLTGATLLLTLCLAPGVPADTALEVQMRDLHIETPRERLPAPGFELLTLDGETVRLGAYRGRLVLLHFWATFCEPCRKELPALDRLAGKLGADSPVILAIAVDRDRPRQVAKFVREHALKLTVPLDPDGKVRTSYEIDALPTTYLIAPDGRFVGRAVGERPWDSPQFRQLISGLRPQMPD